MTCNHLAARLARRSYTERGQRAGRSPYRLGKRSTWARLARHLEAR